MSPKDFRNISHPEPEILTSCVSGNRLTNRKTNTAVPWVDPPRGSTKKRGWLEWQDRSSIYIICNSIWLLLLNKTKIYELVSEVERPCYKESSVLGSESGEDLPRSKGRA